MDPFITLSIVIIIVVVTGGAWGYAIISSLMERRNLELRSGEADPRVEELQVDFGQLEQRLQRLEEEVGFFRELYPSDPPRELLPPDAE